MEKLIQIGKLEELLVARWAHFVDARRLMAFVMACVRDAHLPHSVETEVPVKGVQISISRFEWEALQVSWDRRIRRRNS